MVIRVDGSIAENSLTTNEYYDSSMKYAANTSVFTDWIGVNDCIGMDNEGMLYRYTLNDDQSDLLFHWYSNRTELVPYVKGRYNWSGVVSPEKDCVAFLSRVSSDSTGRNSTVGLFLVDLQGGDPQAIDCSYTFPTDFSAVAQQENKVGILGWF